MGRMQMELHTGIELALELIRQPDPRALLACAGEQMGRVFGVPETWFLELDPSGRTLVCGTLLGQPGFDCDDFSHPFAHVVRDGKPRQLSRAAGYRLDHVGFQTLFEAAGRPDTFWLQPVLAADRQLLGVLVMAGEQEIWPTVIDQPLFQGLLSLLAHQWAGQLRSCDQLWQRRMLKRSLEHLHDAETLRDRCEALAETLIGPSPEMVELRTQIARAAGSQLSVLVQGETGCGKDLVARGIHRFSPRAKGPFVVVNCAAIPDTLLENELFGHTKGAFSGADCAKDGLMAQADGGTLFLDEIGDMPMTLQSKLLRVLETRSFRPLGAQQEQHSNFRLVAATHQPLQVRIQEGVFRRDLFFRLSQFPLKVVPLRERTPDLEALCRHFIRAYSEREGAGPLGISSHALSFLADYRFPGNVRELKNIIEFACLQTPAGDDIQPEQLQLDLLTLEEPRPIVVREVSTSLPGLPPPEEIDDLRSAAQAFEAAVISARLRQYHGNRALAAESLGLPKRTLAHKCQKFNVTEAP